MPATLYLRDKAFFKRDRNFTLPPTFVADQEATFARCGNHRFINVTQTNNAEAVLRDVLDWRDLLRQTVGYNLSSVYCHRPTIKSATLFLADACQQLDDREVGVKKGLKLY